MDAVDITEKNGWRVIKKNIGDADYFLSLAAFKYGALPEGSGAPGSSTEIEYAQALKMEIPVIAAIIGDKARWKASKKEDDPKLARALEDFKDKLRSHPHAEWSTTAELRQNVRELLTQDLFLNPRTGWAPGAERATPAAANAMGRLMAENETLRRQIAVQGGGKARWQKNMRRALVLLNNNRASLSFYYADGENWENPIKCRYLRLFKLLVPELYLGKTTSELSRFLGSILNPELNRAIRKDFPTPSNTIKKIMADLHLLKLVYYSPGDGEEIWEVTDYGKELYTLYRLRQFDKSSKGVEKEKAEPEDGTV
jgi:hypothetical protein